jgi:hypothetical protein
MGETHGQALAGGKGCGGDGTEAPGGEIAQRQLQLRLEAGAQGVVDPADENGQRRGLAREHPAVILIAQTQRRGRFQQRNHVTTPVFFSGIFRIGGAGDKVYL